MSLSNELLLQIQHNGKGLSQQEYEKLASASDTFGLENIRYRLAIIGAAIQYEINDQMAQTIVVSPLNQEAFA